MYNNKLRSYYTLYTTLESFSPRIKSARTMNYTRQVI